MKTNGHGKSGHGTGPNGHGPNGTNGSNGHARPRTGTRLRPGLELTGREGSVREGSGREGSVREAFAGKHLVVTGVTGFLGKVWLGMVLDFLPEVGRLTVIARGKKGEDAAARFQRIVERSPAFRPLREKHGPALRDLVAEKVRVVEARLTEPHLGLGEEGARALAADVDAVVHFAGLTDFEPEPKMALDANVHGARHVADLAALTPHGRYVHVSTCFVAGIRPDPEIPEEITPGLSPNGTRFDPAAEIEALEEGLAKLDTKKERVDFATARANALGWPNIYTYTKGLSEQLLETRDDIASTTFRPAIVECARSYPFAGWNEGINTSGPLVWLLSTSFRRLPAKAKNHFDVVPVDTVARGMVLATAAALRDRARPVYQCGSSHVNPFTFERAVDLTGYAVRRLHERRGTRWEREVLGRLEPHCDDPDREQLLGYKRMRQAAKAMRGFLRDFDLERVVSPALYERIDGDARKESLRSFSMKCRTTDRKLGQVDEMLRQFRPFIHDLHYAFRADHLVEETAALSDEERALFGFDAPELCWRHYWVHVQVPGLDTWCIPLLRGEKVPEDEPLAPAEDGVRAKRGERSADPLRHAV
ncbi:MAG TPA: SDR family oxidoreductase [Polyangiaceae bacterium LLY-WYZ-15_(1-7)]|nr:hypothetical protein [Sandaracinus sp.]MBJ72015.1 hypothetical protein [Sandaracinus sp.]HJL02037.1 SDR family oxidoreductase [Polyangiaceae bacterium LLY-WYZ-15_(1-7)]HJL13933.1 SDR family oxidoreductase [Polyangiaceae bacterium LLY-WYZ-15_(1-7)]HJL34704.1 SDR family oxidoreductase [Polyangiaceae bacterium LLY-WYZ-15_(1-7)]